MIFTFWREFWRHKKVFKSWTPTNSFAGVTVYVNNVEKGQSEIYVVLDEAQIGMRIRESYAIDIDRKFNYMESLGLLDVQISVPPQYKVLTVGFIKNFC